MLIRRTPRNGDLVLLVDSDPDTRMMYAEYFRYQGLHAIAVATARQALALASKVDAIVTGLLLPGYMDGIRLIERLKGDQETRDIPLIVVTGCAWEHQRVRALHAGSDLFLPKPCAPDVLASEVQRLLAARPVPPNGPARRSRRCRPASRARADAAGRQWS